MNPPYSPAHPDADPRTLHQRQVRHVVLVGKLIEYAEDNGLEFSWGETFRTAAQAALNAANGSGIRNSLHSLRLAVDFQLFKNGAYITDAAAYKPVADYWLTLDPLACAGYYFASVDADHFSISYQGRM